MSGSRTLDIEAGSEVITVELDELDPDPSGLLELLTTEAANVPAGVWTKLAGEYWRKGALDAAEQVALAAKDRFPQANDPTSLSSVYALLANLQIARARKAPKMILPTAKHDVMSAENTKEHYYREATTYLNAGDKANAEAGPSANNVRAFLTRGITLLATNSLDEAYRAFESVNSIKPTNIIALMGKARILYVRRQFAQALRNFQRVLQLAPHSSPDPRIGIGLCFWAMDDKVKARAAWQRSLEIHPDEWPADLLLGLDLLNASKVEGQPDNERAQALRAGAIHLEKAFNANMRNAAAANALCELLLRKNQHKRALKLAERTIQFADTLTVLTDGYTRAGRLAHAEGQIAEAVRHFSAAADGQKTALGAIGLAQVQIKNDEFAGAIHTLDKFLETPGGSKSLEATAILACLRACPRPGVSSSETTRDKTRARELFDAVSKALGDRQNGIGGRTTRSQRRVMDDPDMYCEIATLWVEDDLGRARRALTEAARAGGAAADPRVTNNLGAIAALEGDHKEARVLFQSALTAAITGDGSSGLLADQAEAVNTTVLYNLARTYEELGEDNLAKEAYDKLLTRHPEYVDAKARLAQMYMKSHRHGEAQELLKTALTAEPHNLELRASYTNAVLRSGNLKLAKAFVFATLQDHAKHDVYALCAAANIHYMQARESRDATPEGIRERKKGFQRAAEFYEKALALDARCAVAAQGLAIVTAEDALGSLGGALPPGPTPEDSANRVNNAREALDILGKVRECLDDGSVYVNMGHCYYARDEFDRAIESYEAASRRYYEGRNVPVLLCLCRSWYAKATKDQSFTAINTALDFARQSQKLQPADKSITYNIAVLEQKAAEMLFVVPPAKRNLGELEQAIEQAGHAQTLFAELASDPANVVPYSKEMADQRRKYGEGMLRKGDEHLATQRQHDEESRVRIDAARQKRQEERDRLQQIEDLRLEELRIAADKLAEERRIARQQAQEWTAEARAESDEERERKASKRASRKARPADGGASGDEGESGPGQKRKRSRKKKTEQDGEDEEALFSAPEDDGAGAGAEKPKKRGAKKRVVKDEDEEEPAGPPRKKQIKSKEVIEDSDEEMT